jgi:glycosyltransferase involved in cell wall biosynthesis
MNYVSFAASSLVYGLFMARRADVIYAYHPPLTVGVTAGLLRLLRRVPVVYDIQDMWPDTLRATGMIGNARVLSVVGSVCRWVYRRADQIVVLSPGFKRLLIERGVPARKLDVIYNWADETALVAPKGVASVAFPKSNQFRILFAGNMGKAQALDTVLEAAQLLQRRDSRVCWVILGSGVESDRLKRRAVDMQLHNLMFLPRVPVSEVGAYLSAADALLVHLREDPLFEITIPSKTQAYMAVGKPIIMAVGGDAADLVQRSGGGLIARSESPEALADAAERLVAMSAEELAEMGNKAQTYYQQHLSLGAGVGRFSEIFQRLAKDEHE